MMVAGGENERDAIGGGGSVPKAEETAVVGRLAMHASALPKFRSHAAFGTAGECLSATMRR